MKKVFSIINLVCILASIIFVGFNFLSNIETSKNATVSVNNFLSSSENTLLITELEKRIYFIDSRVDEVSDAQINYLNELCSSIERLTELTTSISPRLVIKNERSTNAEKIIKSVNSLEDKRTDFITELARFKIKIEGSLEGDRLSSISIFTQNTINYISQFNQTAQLINEYLKEDNINRYNIVNFYGQAINYLTKNYSNFDFSENSYNTIKEFNSLLYLSPSSVLHTNESTSIYSQDANNFTKYYNLSNKDELISVFYPTSINVSINQSSNNLTLCVYYFCKLFKGDL